MTSPPNTPAGLDARSALDRLLAIRTRDQYQEFRSDLRQRPQWNELSQGDRSKASETERSLLQLLAGATSDPALPLSEVLSFLEDPALARAAAFHLVERYGDQAQLFRELLLAPSLTTPPTLCQEGAFHLIEIIGLAGRQEPANILRTVLLRQYHHYPPAHTAYALARLGLHVDSYALGLSQSISVSQSGSTLVIHHDEKFSGIGRCAHGCRFFPCRVNRYYLGPIEDCKLFDKTDPDSLLDLQDFRSISDRGPTVGEQPNPAEVFDLHHRAAVELEADGKLREAAEVLRVAARFERAPNGQLELLDHAARLLVKAGAASTAYRLVVLTDDKAMQATDEALKRSWDRTKVLLAHELGIYGETGYESAQTSQGQELATLLSRLLRGPQGDPQARSTMISSIEAQLASGRDDGWLTYRLTSYLLDWRRAAHLCADPTNPSGGAISLENLPSTIDLIEYEVLAARQLSHEGRHEEARDRFFELAPRIEATADRNRRLEYFGYRLDALGEVVERETMTVLETAGHARQLFEEALSNRTSAPGRRRFRQRHQRTIEAAIAALIRIAESGASPTIRTEALRETWQIVSATRNPELKKEWLDLTAESSARLGSLEESFHRGLHTALVDGWEPREFIYQFLRPLLHFEMTNGADLPNHSSTRLEAERRPFSGLAVLWFGFREPRPDGRLLTLVRHEDQIRHRWIDHPGTDIFELTTQWSAHIEAKARTGQAPIRAPREVLVRDRSTRQTDPPDSEALDRAVLRLAPFVRNQGKTESLSISVYPDGPVNALPLETLPDPLVPGLFLGERLASTYRLRCESTAGMEIPIDLEGGWLGVGDIPQAPARPSPRQARVFPALPGTRAEVETIAGLLRQSRIGPVETLTGAEAHFEALESRLASLQPSVLHLATHGVGDLELPEACALLLAMDPGGAARTLLPFRLIRQLPLGSVRLVILSACSSLVGPTDLGTGIEGLAWAFLKEGVTHVVATRYPVDDAHAKRFMAIFYRHLLAARGTATPVAEIVRKTRVKALRQAAVPLHEVGAWALFR